MGSGKTWEGGALQRQANDSDRNCSRSERKWHLRSCAYVSDLFSNLYSLWEYFVSVEQGKTGRREGAADSNTGPICRWINLSGR